MNEPIKKFTRVEYEMMLDEMKNTLWVTLQAQEMKAKIRKAKYDALMKEGFNESQALEIVSKSSVYD